MTVSVEELRGAWLALKSGRFASDLPHMLDGSPCDIWTPSSTERAVAVVGCSGGVGASIVALATATAVGGAARVVECCFPGWSGFSAAATAELGETAGWRRGSRGPVLLERRASPTGPLPLPAVSDVGLTVVDASWAAVTTPGSWLGPWLRSLPQVVLVTSATVPGIRRLETCLETLPSGCVPVAVLVGPSLKKLPKPVSIAAAGLPAVQLVAFPLEPALMVTGITPHPLSTPLIKAGKALLTVL